MAIKKYVVIHHSATQDGTVLRDFEAIQSSHIARGWRDIGYHWVIERVNGIYTAIAGRAENEDGAHCIGRNADGIGICLVGDWSYNEPPAEAYAVLEALVEGICSRHPIEHIDGHNAHAATACPGKINVERLRWTLSNERDPELAEFYAQQNARIIMDRAGVSQETISFLRCYRWGDELLQKLASAITNS